MANQKVLRLGLIHQGLTKIIRQLIYGTRSPNFLESCHDEERVNATRSSKESWIAAPFRARNDQNIQTFSKLVL
jgi:hypothetical protein